MMKKIIIQLILITFTNSYSQNTIVYPTNTNLKDGIFNNPNLILKRNASFDHTFLNIKINKFKDISKIKGSPYNDINFRKGILILNDKQLDTLYYRYNSYQDEIELKNNLNDSIYNKLNKINNLKIKDQNDQYEVWKLKFNSDIPNYRIVRNLYPNDGNILYELVNTKFMEGKIAATSMVKSTVDQFKTKKYYYFNLNNDELYLYNGKSKSFIERVELKNRAKVKNFIKNQKIRFSSNEDFKKIIIYAKSLQ
jgi:hypothetical protein